MAETTPRTPGKHFLTDEQHAQLKGYAKLGFTDKELGEIFRLHRMTAREYRIRPIGQKRPGRPKKK